MHIYIQPVTFIGYYAVLPLSHYLLTMLFFFIFLNLHVRAAWKELEALIWHACRREYKTEAYDPYIESNNLEQAAEKFLDLAAINLA